MDVAAEGHQGRATARGARLLLMSPGCRYLLELLGQLVMVVRARKPLLLCLCQYSVVRMASEGRERPPVTRVSPYGARVVVENE